MRTYRQLTREQLGLTTDEWDRLVAFIDEIRPAIENARWNQQIESPPPRIIRYEESERVPEFDPGGWIGEYPGGVTVYPGKLNEFEYRYLIEQLAGWLELWDIPTAAAVLPLLHTNLQEQRSLLLGYSQALIAFTEEALAHRPPVTVERETQVGPEPRGPIEFQTTIRERAVGSQNIGYRRTRFSLKNYVNLLLVRFHAELANELNELAKESIVMTPSLRRHQQYHQGFIENEFPEEFLTESLDIDFTDTEILATIRENASGPLVELVDIWESYRRDQALGINFEDQLNVGIKPIEKLYELWLLKELLDLLALITGEQPTASSDGLSEFAFGSDLMLFYNTSLYEYSRLLAADLDVNPGRPDFALAVNDDIVWIGDAKYSPRSNIDLEDYQRLLSYTVDLMSADTGIASIIYVDRDTEFTAAETADYDVFELPMRPVSREKQRSTLGACLRECLPDSLRR